MIGDFPDVKKPGEPGFFSFLQQTLPEII